jgi:hypothetical protein
LLFFNIISLICDTLAPAVRKLADAAKDEVFLLPMWPLLNNLYHFLIIAKPFSAQMLLKGAEGVIV